MYKLEASRVNEVFMECLFKDGEDKSEFVAAPGVMCNVGFNPLRIREFTTEITEMLLELPENFQEGKGGGWSFLEACMTKDGDHWAEHRTIEQLFQLGEGIGRVKCLFPRKFWDALPGGMPYYAITDKPFDVPLTKLEDVQEG